MYENTDFYVEKEINLLLTFKKALNLHGYQHYDGYNRNYPRRYAYRMVKGDDGISKILDIEIKDKNFTSYSSIITCLADLFFLIFKDLSISLRFRINNSKILASLGEGHPLLSEINCRGKVEAEMIKEYLGLEAMLAIAKQQPKGLYKIFSKGTLLIKELEETAEYLPRNIKGLVGTDVLLGVLDAVKGFTIEASAYYQGKCVVVAFSEETGSNFIASINVDTLLAILRETKPEPREVSSISLVLAKDAYLYKKCLQKIIEQRKRGYQILYDLEGSSGYCHGDFQNVLKISEEGVEVLKGIEII